MTTQAEQVLAGSKLAASWMIRYLEDNDQRGAEGLKALYPHAGRAYILGITGPAGAGKSTLVDQLISALRGRQMKVGVIAVDPSSPFTGGAVLGDRVRMQRHSSDEGVFIRSMASRGHLGGLSRATSEAVIVLDAMGHDVVVLETVGVGQDELEIADLAHTTAVISLPGTGDDIQAIKAGILEIGDVLIVNKADRPGADETVSQLRGMLRMRDAGIDGWTPPVLKAIGLSGWGVAEIVDACLAHRRHLIESGQLARRVQERDLHLFKELVKEMVCERMFRIPGMSGMHALLEELRLRKIDPRTAAERALASMQGHPP